MRKLLIAFCSLCLATPGWASIPLTGIGNAAPGGGGGHTQFLLIDGAGAGALIIAVGAGGLQLF